MLKNLENGISIEGVAYGKIIASVDSQSGSNTWLSVTLTEGKNREIRKVMKFIGLEVARLIRVSYGPFQLGSLQKGDVREVSGKVLKEQLGSRFAL
jgi:23S rRNA pseudouridine2605 synthase